MPTDTDRVQLVAHLDQLAATVKSMQHHGEAHYSSEQIAALMASQGFAHAAEVLRLSVTESVEVRLAMADVLARRAHLAVQIGFA